MGRLEVLSVAGFGVVLVLATVAAPLQANPPKPSRDSLAANRFVEPDADLAATRALAEALAALNRGQRPAARHQLETVVTRFPDTRAADHARHVLSELQAGADRDVVPAADGRTASDPQRSPVGPASPAPAEDTRDLVVGSQIRSLQEDLRLVAGDSMFFAPGAVEPAGDARRVVFAQARWLKRNATLVVEVEGHADDPGIADQKRLSLERATLVRVRLIEAGIEPHRIRLRALGRTQPIAICDSPVCAAHNRRVLLTVVGRDFGGAAPQR